jgi:hypothetical protein
VDDTNAHHTTCVSAHEASSAVLPHPSAPDTSNSKSYTSHVTSRKKTCTLTFALRANRRTFSSSSERPISVCAGSDRHAQHNNGNNAHVRAQSAHRGERVARSPPPPHRVMAARSSRRSLQTEYQHTSHTRTRHVNAHLRSYRAPQVLSDTLSKLLEAGDARHHTQCVRR